MTCATRSTEVAVTLEKVGQENRVVPALQAALPGYEVDSWDTLRPEIREAMDSKLVITGFFGFIVVFIASIGILNLMMMAVFERTREMGVLAALGMKGRQIMGLFLLEGAMIGLVGAVIGCSLGLGINWADRADGRHRLFVRGGHGRDHGADGRRISRPPITCRTPSARARSSCHRRAGLALPGVAGVASGAGGGAAPCVEVRPVQRFEGSELHRRSSEAERWLESKE